MIELEIMTQHMSKIKKVKMFHYLTRQELKNILERAEIVNYAPGEKIISQGDTGRFFFAIIEGMAQVSVCDSDNEFFLCTIDRGQVFGEAAIFMTEA